MLRSTFALLNKLSYIHPDMQFSISTPVDNTTKGINLVIKLDPEVYRPAKSYTLYYNALGPDLDRPLQDQLNAIEDFMNKNIPPIMDR